MMTPVERAYLREILSPGLDRCLGKESGADMPEAWRTHQWADTLLMTDGYLLCLSTCFECGAYGVRDWSNRGHYGIQAIVPPPPPLPLFVVSPDDRATRDRLSPAKFAELKQEAVRNGIEEPVRTRAARLLLEELRKIIMVNERHRRAADMGIELDCDECRTLDDIDNSDKS